MKRLSTQHPEHATPSLEELSRHYPQLDTPPVSRRALLALSALFALDLAGCGGGGSGSGGSGGTGVVSTFAGSVGTPGSANGTGTAASFYYPAGVAVDSSGNVYVGDTYNHLIRKITGTGVVSTLAGSGTLGSANGTGTAASFSYPTGVALDSSGNVYVADYGNNLIRKISVAG